MTDRNEKGGEAKRLIAEFEGFQNQQDEEMDELDQEVAFISKMHQEKKSKNKNKDLDGVAGDQIASHDDINI